MRSEQIYNLVNGFLCDDNSIPIEFEVINEFEKGRECEKISQEIYPAQCRLAEKLGDEDEDVEAIINGMNSLLKIISLKMYEYGRKDKHIEEK